MTVFIVRNFLKEVSDTFKNFQTGIMWILVGCLCAILKFYK